MLHLSDVLAKLAGSGKAHTGCCYTTSGRPSRAHRFSPLSVRAPLGRGRVPRDDGHGGRSQVFRRRVRAHEAATGPAGPHGRLALRRDRAGFTHSDVDNATFCRAASGRPVSCDAGCLLLHKPMKYDASNIVVSVGRRGQGGKAVKRALAALKLIDRDEACVSP